MIPQETIEQVAAATDIVEVINGYVPLKRAGSTWKANCPFHREKSPSFTVNPARQMFKCFGCGVGGSVFKFVTMFVNIDFPSAVRMLAERAGIPIVEEFSGNAEEERGAGKARRQLLKMHAEAAEWMHRQLMKSSGAQAAREYLKGRGLSAEVAARWKIGYAPGQNACLRWGHENGYRRDEMLLGGLVKENDAESGRADVYDRFRDRLMFPIRNEVGEVVAFSGRVLSAETKGPKYVNSPESPIFTKGRVLFGLYEAKRAMLEKKFAIICEGQIDLISVFEAGVQNVAASQGTAFTEQQARLLKRHADEVVLCFDADNAGQAAAEKTLPPLLEANMTVRVATMPPGEDPDSLIRTQGVEAFEARIKEAKDFFDFQIERLAENFDVSSPRGKAQFCRKIAESVALVTDNVLREAIVAKVSSRIGVSPRNFQELLRKKPIQRRVSQTVDLHGDGPEDEVLSDSFEKPPGIIEDLLKAALESEEARGWLNAQPWEEILPQVNGSELLTRLLLSNATDQPLATFLAMLPSAETDYLTDLLVGKGRDKGLMKFQQPLEVARGWWMRLERDILNGHKVALLGQLSQPGLSVEETTQLQKEVLDLEQRLKEIARL